MGEALTVTVSANGMVALSVPMLRLEKRAAACLARRSAAKLMLLAPEILGPAFTLSRSTRELREIAAGVRTAIEALGPEAASLAAKFEIRAEAYAAAKAAYKAAKAAAKAAAAATEAPTEEEAGEAEIAAAEAEAA